MTTTTEQSTGTIQKHRITFYIASGRKNAQYTLRRYNNYLEGNPFANPDHYIKNLGNDPERALGMANDYKDTHIDSFTYGGQAEVIWNFEVDFDLNEYGINPWEASNLHEVALGRWPFGKFQGQNIEDTEDWYILYWAKAENDKGSDAIAHLIAKCIDICNQRDLFEQDRIKRLNAVKKQEEDEARKKLSQYVGNVGDRQRFSIELVFVFAVESMYGTSYINRGIDQDGNTIVYFGTTNVGCKGDRVEFDAKIKKHEEYKGEKQTAVQRPTKVKITEAK